MKAVFLLLITLGIGCTSNPSVGDHEVPIDARVATSNADPADSLELLDAYADLFVTIADTSHAHEAMLKTMHRLHDEAGAVEMEYPGNPYDPVRDSLLVPVDAEDEIYRGTYVPRRVVDHSMSIEYIDAYDTSAFSRTMAVVTGIWSTQEQADSIIRAHSHIAPLSLVIPVRLYQGCIH